MPGEGGAGEIPEKPDTHLDKLKNTDHSTRYFNPYRPHINDIQNPDSNTKDVYDLQKWTGQLKGLFEMLGKQLTPEVTQKLNESTDAGDRTNETTLPNTHTQELTTKKRQCEGVYRLFMGPII